MGPSHSRCIEPAGHCVGWGSGRSCQCDPEGTTSLWNMETGVYREQYCRKRKGHTCVRATEVMDLIDIHKALHGRRTVKSRWKNTSQMLSNLPEILLILIEEHVQVERLVRACPEEPSLTLNSGRKSTFSQQLVSVV